MKMDSREPSIGGGAERRNGEKERKHRAVIQKQEKQEMEMEKWG
jgi:hypothetical protein